MDRNYNFYLHKYEMFLAKGALPLSTLKKTYIFIKFKQKQDWNSSLAPQIQN